MYANCNFNRYSFYFVHGLTGHAYNTFTARLDQGGTTCTWPRDLLPEYMENKGRVGRFSTFGYESTLRRARHVDKHFLENTAEDLLNEIDKSRPKGCQRPIFFVCHSLGGLIVCQAMVIAMTGTTSQGPLEHFKDVFVTNNSCVVKGITFFGTPFKGSAIANYVAPVATMLRLDASQLARLRRNDREVKSMLYEFEKLRMMKETLIPLLIFWEKKGLRTLFFSTIVSFCTKIVNQC